MSLLRTASRAAPLLALLAAFAFVAAPAGGAPFPLSGPPSPPAWVRLTVSTSASVGIGWADVSGIAGYGVYNNGSRVATTQAQSATVSGLKCGTAYALAVDAYDSAGQRSTPTTISGSTTACVVSASPSSTQPPPAPPPPSWIRLTGSTSASVGIGWADVSGLAGYDIYRDGSRVATTQAQSATVSGLKCGTAYALAVDSYDAAYRRSAAVTIAGSTTACVASSPPPAPTPAAAPLAPAYLFSDEFNGVGAPDPSKWIVLNGLDGSPTQTWSSYSAANIFQDGAGHLVLRVSKGTMGRAYDGSQMATYDYWGGWGPAHSVKASVDPPVHIEISAKLPAGPGLWPAFWPMGVTKLPVIELDILEARLFHPNENSCHIHNATEFNAVLDMGVDLTAGFHVYWADYYVDRVVLGVDSRVCGQTALPSSQPVGMTLDNIVGDSAQWGGQGGPPSDAQLPADLVVDYVRAWRIAP